MVFVVIGIAVIGLVALFKVFDRNAEPYEHVVMERYGLF